MSDAVWRDELDALHFATGEAGRICFMHRLAFRRFLGPSPSGEQCLVFFEENRAAFLEAAAAKAEATSLPPDTNFHINSRDIARIMGIPL